MNEENKIVYAAQTWAAVDQGAERFLKTKDADKSVRVMMTGRNDGKRSAVTESEALRRISSVTLIEDIQVWVDSEDRTFQGYKSLMKRIRDVAPAFFESHLSKEDRLVKDEPCHLERRCKALGSEQAKLKAAMLTEATVIFTTLNSLGSKCWSDIEGLKESVGTLIVDEAGQATDPDLFIGYGLSSQRLLLLGDHRQLPPSARSVGAKKGGLARSTLERLYEAGEEGALHKHMLTMQYRMPPSVVEWPNRMFYNGLLQTAKVASCDRAGKPPQYRVIDVAFGEGAKVGGGTSLQNAAEAACVMRVVRQLRGSYDLGTDLRGVLVITPYAAQRDLLQRHLLNCFGDVPRERLPTVSTIDGCQGAEREHVVLSLVRTDMHQVNSFATCPQHLCVALTRAKETMAVVCHAEALRLQSPHAASLVQHAKDTPGCLEVLSERRMTHRGTIVGKQFIAAGKSGVEMQVGDLGYKVFHGDEATLRLLDDTLGGKLVIDIDVTTEAQGRKEAFVCSIVNDGHVCFHAPHREDRVEILDAVRELAKQAAGHTCNSAAVAIGERQPADGDYLTLAVADKVFAEKLMNGATVVRIRDADNSGKTKAVPASLPQEPYYNNFEPVDSRFPRVRIDSWQVREYDLTYRSAVRVLLNPEHPGRPGHHDVWYADVQVKESLDVEDLLWTSVGVEEDAPAQVQGDADEQEPVREGGVFSLDPEGTRVFDDAVSCRTHGSGGWEVSLYIADPEADGPLRQRLSEQLVDMPSRRLWPADKRHGASLRSGEARSCLCLTFIVCPDGAVSKKPKWTLQQTTVARNFFVSDELSWSRFVEEQTPGEGPQLLATAVRAMMQRTRYLEEATQTRRELHGPVHLQHYLVLCAKRAAAHALRFAGGVLFANIEPALAVACRVLGSIDADVDDGTERALCVAFDTQLPTLARRSIKAAGAAASVRQAARATDIRRWSATFVGGVSAVSFTSPLRKFNDFAALQQLKRACGLGPVSPAASAVLLHQRKLDELRKQSIKRELEDAREPKTGVTKAIVTQVDHDRVSLYFEETDMLVDVPAKTLGKDIVNTPFVTTYQARAVSGNKKTFTRHQTHHIVPYSKPTKIMAGMQVVGAKRKKAAPQENTDEKRKKLLVQFAGEPTREIVKRSKDEVHAAMLKLISSDLMSCMRLHGQTDHHGRWRYCAKNAVCRFDKTTCNAADRCTYIHGATPDDVRDTYKDNLAEIKEAAKQVSDELSCTVLAENPAPVPNASSPGAS